MFDRVLVANRGEIAVRVIRALHELGIEAVAVYSTADRDALHVELADQAVCIGPPAAAESYLSISNVVAAAETTGCDAVHPGYGFLAENAEFVRACDDNDVVFIGPTADVVEQMGDKVRAKEAMQAAGVPLVPGSDGAVVHRRARRAAFEAGFPVLLKASAGGGGKGMRLVVRRGRARARLRRRERRGGGRVRRRRALRREARDARPPRRDPGAVRRRRRSAHARRARVLHPATPPEARGGVAVGRARRRDARGDGGDRRSAHARRSAIGTPGRSSSSSARTAPSTSSRSTAGSRSSTRSPSSSPGIDIVREQVRIAAGEQLAATGRAARQRPRHRDPHQRRGPRARLSPVAGHGHALRPAARPGRARRHGGRVRQPRSRPTTTR